MKYFIFLGLFFIPTISFGNLNLEDTKFGQFLLNENSVVNPDNVQTELEKEDPRKLETLLKAKTFSSGETALQLIAKRLRNEEEIIRSIVNVMMYLYQHSGDERALESLFSFIYKDNGFIYKYDSKQNYPKISMFLYELNKNIKEESSFRNKINDIVIIERTLKYPVNILATFLGASGSLIFFDFGVSGGMHYILSGATGVGLGVMSGVLWQAFFNWKAKQSVKNLAQCKQSFVDTVQKNP